MMTFAAQGLTLGAARTDLYLPLLKNKRVGMIVNQTSMVNQMHLVDYLLAKKVDIRKVMAPEHGFRGDAGAGETIADGHDEKTGLPILSLYGKTKKPTPAMLQDIDILIFDIQDVGARFYTYISTLHLVMEAAAEQGIPLIVLDRPNPNGRFVDGPVREEAFASFVGMDPIPLLHGMTMAELAQMIKGENWISHAAALSLHVVKMANYRKDQLYSLPVPPSPNLPNDQAIALYPSLCLFEGTTVSVGRGTPYPFQVLGHDKVKLGEFQFSPQSLPNSAPYPKLEGKVLFGMDLRHASLEGFDLSLLLSTYEQFKRADESFIDRPAFFDKLAGTDQLRRDLEAGKSEADIRQQWQPALTRFKQQRRPYLLY
ncbi:DUF1343 domain-containing protein [Alteromonas sp. 14N.309.X.WAT.G.H12]